MKLVLRDYIESLKEDQELDYLITELLLNMSVLPLTRPTKGRQHGVDIAAVGHDIIDKQRKIFLIVVKSGDLNRTTWDTGTNAVRPTINEILDTYIPTCIPEIYKDLPIKIIVSSNGQIDSNLNQDWTQFTNKHSNAKISFDFWGIDFLTLNVTDYLFNEGLIPRKIQSHLKKMLVFMEVSDYDLRDFYNLLNEVFESLDYTKKKINRKNLKLFRTINLSLNIVFQRGKEIDNLMPVIRASERAVLVTWGLISKHNLLNKTYLREFQKIVNTKEKIDFAYFVKIQPYLLVHEGLALGHSVNHLEYSVNTFEQIGILSNIGNHYLNISDIYTAFDSEEGDNLALRHLDSATVVAEHLVHLINNNSAAFNPTLDEHMIEIQAALTLLIITEKRTAATNWILGMLNYTMQNHKINKTFPQFVTNFETLFEQHFNGKPTKENSSMLFTFFAEWALILKDIKLYNTITKIVNENFPDLNLQLWIPEANTEEGFYFENCMRKTGSTKHSIKLHENHLEYEAEMTEERNMFCAEREFTFIKYGYRIIGYWAFRHYRIYPFPNFWREFLSSKFCFNFKKDPLLPKTNPNESALQE